MKEVYTPWRELTDEQKRQVFEDAQARRKERKTAKTMKGKCTRCHRRKSRPNEKTCYPCHAKKQRIYRVHKRVRQQAEAKVERAKVRERRVLKKGLNPAYAEFLTLGR